jgi:ADP-ribosylglycohydrolase
VPAIDSRIRGCLLGGAIGDALESAAAGRPARTTSVTQLVLFAAEGLVLFSLRRPDAPATPPEAFVYQAYLRWLSTQPAIDSDQLVRRFGTCSLMDGRLTAERAFCRARNPDPTALAALASGRMGTCMDPVNQRADGHAIPPAALAGLILPLAEVGAAAAGIAALTHGHPAAHHSAASCAILFAHLAGGLSLQAAAAAADASIADRPENDPGAGAAMTAAIRSLSRPDGFDLGLAAIGRGRKPEKTLAAGLLCAAAAPDDFIGTVRLAAGLSRQLPGCAVIAGQIAGTLLGSEGIDSDLAAELEFQELILELADDLAAARDDAA